MTEQSKLPPVALASIRASAPVPAAPLPMIQLTGDVPGKAAEHGHVGASEMPDSWLQTGPVNLWMEDLYLSLSLSKCVFPINKQRMLPRKTLLNIQSL